MSNPINSLQSSFGPSTIQIIPQFILEAETRLPQPEEPTYGFLQVLTFATAEEEKIDEVSGTYLL